MSNRFFFGLVLAGAVASLTPAGLVATVPESVSVSVSVPYGDLNLTSIAGRTRFQARLVRAAAQVCGSYDIRELGAMRDALACRREALRGVDAQVQLAISGAAGQRIALVNAPADRAAP